MRTCSVCAAIELAGQLSPGPAGFQEPDFAHGAQWPIASRKSRGRTTTDGCSCRDNVYVNLTVCKAGNGISSCQTAVRCGNRSLRVFGSQPLNPCRMLLRSPQLREWAVCQRHQMQTAPARASVAVKIKGSLKKSGIHKKAAAVTMEPSVWPSMREKASMALAS